VEGPQRGDFTANQVEERQEVAQSALQTPQVAEATTASPFTRFTMLMNIMKDF